MNDRSYSYARLWVPLYDAAALAVSQPVYLIEAADGFEGFVAEKNVTLVGLFNELGHAGWKISPVAERVTNPSPELQLLVDATLDEVDGGLSSELLASAHPVDEYDVYGMRRRD
ncbi:hypothetical protein [Nocardioides montaniterrae]